MTNILPTPKICRENKEKRLSFSTSIISCKNFESVIPTFNELLVKLFKTSLSDGKGGFELKFDPTLSPDAYVIDTEGESFVIRASAKEGLMYGLASALQLISVTGNTLSAPSLYIEDKPDKEYRSLMLDFTLVSYLLFFLQPNFHL